MSFTPNDKGILPMPNDVLVDSFKQEIADCVAQNVTPEIYPRKADHVLKTLFIIEGRANVDALDNRERLKDIVNAVSALRPDERNDFPTLVQTLHRKLNTISSPAP